MAVTIADIPYDEVTDLDDVYVERLAKVKFAPDDAETLKRLTLGLIGQSATLADGRVVERAGDSLRWLLEQLAAAA